MIKSLIQNATALLMQALLAALLFLGTLPAIAQQQSSFKVEVTGRGKPMILIPGLTCPGEVWEETVNRYKKDYQLHVLSLAGFAGTSPIQTDSYLETVRKDLAKYIRQQKLQKPTVVGHSLGGFLGMWLSIKEPDLVGALVVVDSAPFLPALINPAITAEGAKNMAMNMRQGMQHQTKEQVRQSQPQVLRNMITDEAKIAQALEWSVNSDMPTVAQAMYELYTIDLRPELHAVKAPTLFIAAWSAYKNYGVTHQSTEQNYKAQLANMPAYELVINDTAKHFIMWDDPQGFYAAMDSFIAKKKK